MAQVTLLVSLATLRFYLSNHVQRHATQESYNSVDRPGRYVTSTAASTVKIDKVTYTGHG